MSEGQEDASEGVESLFFELAGDLRLAMLVRLSTKSYRLSQLTSQLDATMQEAHRNITRLIESRLVAKNSSSDLSLTAYGRSVIDLVPAYRFLFSNREYFLDHTLGDLPPKFVQRIGAFEGCERVNGIMVILQRWKTLYNNSEKYIKEIMAQVPLDLIETVSQRVEKGVAFSYIFATNAPVPKGRLEMLQKVGWRELVSKGLVKRRMLDNVKVMTIFNEKEGCVIFPNLKGEADLNAMFYGQSREFLEWCDDFFAHVWQKSGPFEEGKLSHEV